MESTAAFVLACLLAQTSPAAQRTPVSPAHLPLAFIENRGTPVDRGAASGARRPGADHVGVPGSGRAGVHSRRAREGQRLRKLGFERNLEIDGGITLETIEAASRAGAHAFVSGTGIFKGADLGETIKRGRNSVGRASGSCPQDEAEARKGEARGRDLGLRSGRIACREVVGKVQKAVTCSFAETGRLPLVRAELSQVAHLNAPAPSNVIWSIFPK
jgi:hypothetical protein